MGTDGARFASIALPWSFSFSHVEAPDLIEGSVDASPSASAATAAAVGIVGPVSLLLVALILWRRAARRALWLRMKSVELHGGDLVRGSADVTEDSGAAPYRGPPLAEPQRQGLGWLGGEGGRRANLHCGWAAVFALALLALNFVLLGPYWQKVASGGVREPRVLSVDTVVRGGEPPHRVRCSVEAETLSGDHFHAELQGETCRTLELLLAQQQTANLPFFVAARSPSTYNFGTGPVLGTGSCYLSWVILLVLAIAYALHASRIEGARGR